MASQISVVPDNRSKPSPPHSESLHYLAYLINQQRLDERWEEKRCREVLTQLLDLDIEKEDLLVARKALYRVAKIVRKDPALREFGETVVRMMGTDVTICTCYLHLINAIAKKARKDSMGISLIRQLILGQNRVFVEVFSVIVGKQGLTPAILCSFGLALIDYCRQINDIPEWIYMLGSLPEDKALLTKCLILIQQSAFNPAYIDALRGLRTSEPSVCESILVLLDNPDLTIGLQSLTAFSNYAQQSPLHETQGTALVKRLRALNFHKGQVPMKLFAVLNQAVVNIALLAAALIETTATETDKTVINYALYSNKHVSGKLVIEEMLSNEKPLLACLTHLLCCDLYIPSLSSTSFRLFNCLTGSWEETVVLQNAIRFCEATSYVLLSERRILSCGGRKLQLDTHTGVALLYWADTFLIDSGGKAARQAFMKAARDRHGLFFCSDKDIVYAFGGK